MRSLVLAVVACVVLSASAVAASLYTESVGFPTHGLACDGSPAALYWSNTTGQPLWLTAIRTRQSVKHAAPIDQAAGSYVVTRLWASRPSIATQPALFLSSTWQRSAFEIGVKSTVVEFPYGEPLAPGEWLTLEVTCWPGAGVTTHGHTLDVQYAQ